MLERRVRVKKDRPPWLERLITAVIEHRRQSGRSLRQISLSARLGPNFLTQLMQDDWKEPLFSNVVQLCRELGISVSYVATGAEVTQWEEEIVAHLCIMSPEQQRSVLDFLRSLLPAGVSHR